MESSRQKRASREALRTTPIESETDLRIWRSGPGGWKFELVSPKARRWARSNLNFDRYQTCENVFRTDVSGVNSLIQRGRMAGLVAECTALRNHER